VSYYLRYLTYGFALILYLKFQPDRQSKVVKQDVLQLKITDL